MTYLDTTKHIDFISSQSMSAYDIIKYCLQAGVDKKNRPSYFLYNLILDGYWLWNPNSNIEDMYDYFVYKNNMRNNYTW
jgi:hypothetical protein